MEEYLSRFKCNTLTVIFMVLFVGLFKSYAQCPTVTNPIQSFCDIESLLISDLVATDNGNGVVWYDTATSTTPLPNSFGIVDGEDYYADDNSGTCGTRQRVDVVIYGPPTGFNFQGVCVENASDATIADLFATGNDVQWYLTPTGGIALDPSTILTDNTIYYADQSNPDTGCRTSRLSVLVNVGLVPTPTGNPIQEFCNFPDNPPTVGDLVASGLNNWYDNISSALLLDPSTLLIDGETYYATTLDPPCESVGRFEVTVAIIQPDDAGEDGVLDLCITDTAVDLFNSLEGSPDAGGIWTPTLTSGTGIFDPNLDAPGVYTYTVINGPPCVDVSATVTVTVGDEAVAGEDGLLDICNNDTPQDLFNSLGGTPDTGGTWSPTLTSGSGIFDPSIDVPGIYTYTVTGGPCGDASATVTVTISQEPNAGEDGTLNLCSNDAAQDLFNNLNGTPDIGGTWSPALASGTGIFDPTVDASGVYTYTVTNACDTVSANVTVSISPESNAGEDGILDICSNSGLQDLFNSLGGTPDTGGTWSPTLASGTGILDPNIDASGIYTYTVAGIPPCDDATATITVTITLEPNAGINGSLDICNDDTPQDLFNSLGGTPEPGGIWSPSLASGTGIFDPSIDAPGVYTYTVIGTPPCLDATATVTVTVNASVNAGTNGTLDLCSNSTPEDLFDSLGGIPDLGGIWSPALASGTGLFDPAIDNAGIYTYTVIGTAPCGDASATVTVTISEEPNAGINGSIDICDDIPQDLFNSLGGTPDLGGTWSPALASGTGIFDPNVDAPGVYTYTIIGIPPCMDASATVTVNLGSTANAGSNGTLDICNNEGIQDLFNSLGGTPDSGGTWSPALASSTGIFDPLVDASGIYTYTVAGTPPCADASATVNVTVSTPPNAGNDVTLVLCNTGGAIDLFIFLGGSPDPGGTWSPALASGTGVFDPALDPEGIYTYTVFGGPCGNDSAQIDLTLTDPSDAGEDAAIALCETDTPIDLFDILGGTPDTGGVWTPILASGTGVFDPNIDAPGVYTYTVGANTTESCDVDTATVTVSVGIDGSAGDDGAIQFCSNDIPQDLFNSLGGSPETGGTWSPALASGTGVFDPAVDSAGSYTYTITNACGSDSAIVIVTVLQEANAGIDGILNLCSNSSPEDLFNSLGGTPETGGIWSPSLTSGTGVFDPTVDVAGIYTYTVSNADCGDSSATVTVSIQQEPNAGTDGLLDICNDGTPQDLFNSLMGTPQVGGIWSPALASGSGIFDPAIDAAGTYTYTITGTPPCMDATANVTVTVSTIPNAGSDGILAICINSTPEDLFNSLGGSPDAGGVWTPALASGTGIFDPTVDSPGEYTYTVTNACGTSSSMVTVSVSDVPDISGARLSIASICLGDSALVEIDDATSLTNGDYLITYDVTGANVFQDVVLVTFTDGSGSFVIADTSLLNAGIHTLEILTFSSADGVCNADLTALSTVQFTVEEATTPTLIADGGLFCNDESPTISDLTNNIVETDDITWYDMPTGGTAYSDTTLLIDGQTYYASITTTIGCISAIRLAVTIEFEECGLVIPDGFSPNSDGINDDFHIINLGELYPNFKLIIYNRHGNTLYEGDINTPNWNGISDKSAMGDSEVPAGVYFYILEFNDGDRKPKQGRVYLNR